MGITELGNALGINKSVACRLVKKGMPTSSAQAAQAWREIHAKPRAKRGQPGTVPKPPKLAPQPPLEKPTAIPAKPAPSHADPEPDDEDNTPRQSLRRARLAEKVGFHELDTCKRNGGSIEDIRKANSIYIASRNNRHKAERDFKEWQQQEGILLYFDEARDIVSRPHIAAKQMMEVMPKTLAPRLYGQPQKAIEKALAEWLDTLTAVIRKSI